MKHLLLDVNIVVDACTDRSSSVESVAAIAKAMAAGVALWVYAGSVQTLEYVLAGELVRLNAKRGLPPPYSRPCSTQGQIAAGYTYMAKDPADRFIAATAWEEPVKSWQKGLRQSPLN